MATHTRSRQQFGADQSAPYLSGAQRLRPESLDTNSAEMRRKLRTVGRELQLLRRRISR